MFTPKRYNVFTRRALSRVAVLVLAAGVVITACDGTAVARGGKGGGGGGCIGEGLEVYVYNFEAEVEINSTLYDNGTFPTLCAGVPYTIQPSFESGSKYTFSQWITNAGSIGKPLVAKTTFTPTDPLPINAALVLVVEGPNETSGWAGYVATAEDVYAAGTQFTVPETSDCSSCSTSMMSFWVGIGGSGPSDEVALWQAGISISWYFICEAVSGGCVQTPDPSCAPCYQLFSESIAKTGSSDLQYGFVTGLGAGTHLTISLSENDGDSVARISAGGSNNWTSYVDGFTPTGGSVEWISEAFPDVYWSDCTLYCLNFTNPSVSFVPGTIGSYIMPMGAYPIIRSEDPGLSPYNQYTLPSLITSNDVFTIYNCEVSCGV
jgi:hypothetical protein